MKVITKEQIVFSLKLMGIEEGDVLLMHSALSSIGRVEGGADAVIDALLEAVGESGTVAVSTLSFEQPYNAATSPTTVGIIAETFRKRPNAVRSLSPIHSITAIGARAQELTCGHEAYLNACGLGTPYTKLRDMGAKILLMGVELIRSSVQSLISHAPAPVFTVAAVSKVSTPRPAASQPISRTDGSPMKW